MTIFSIYVAVNITGGLEMFGTSLMIVMIPIVLLIYLLIFQFIRMKDHKEHEIYRIKKIILESLPMLIIPLSWTAVGGLAIASYEELFLVNPSLLVMLPALSDLAGDFGFITSSRLSESLHVGRIQPKFKEVFTIKWELATIVFIGFISASYLGILSYLTTTIINIGNIGLMKIVGISLISVMMLVSFQIILSVFVSFIAFARGLDPDNVTIPIVADLGDMGGIFFLIASAIILGVL
jgi:mgtE-like transporter